MHLLIRWKCSAVVTTLLNLLLILLQTLETTGYDGRVVNGSDATAGEFPFMISLFRASNGRHICGASLLSESWAMTAAHCVVNAEATSLRVHYGSIDLDANTTNVMNVTKIHVHEEYDPKNIYIHDIALLMLQLPLAFARHIQAVRLPAMDEQTGGNLSAQLIGWGLNATGGSVQKRLQKATILTFTDEECSRRHELTIHPSTICAGLPQGGKGQCSGDSGGPLLLNSTQIGIVSWSRKPCTVPPYPGVFTEVSAYIPWIEETIRMALEAPTRS